MAVSRSAATPTPTGSVRQSTEPRLYSSRKTTRSIGTFGGDMHLQRTDRHRPHLRQRPQLPQARARDVAGIDETRTGYSESDGVIQRHLDGGSVLHQVDAVPNHCPRRHASMSTLRDSIVALIAPRPYRFVTSTESP